MASGGGRAEFTRLKLADSAPVLQYVPCGWRTRCAEMNDEQSN
jgi:hypothetical protein